jgi:hypothetical protein
MFGVSRIEKHWTPASDDPNTTLQAANRMPLEKGGGKIHGAHSSGFHLYMKKFHLFNSAGWTFHKGGLSLNR